MTGETMNSKLVQVQHNHDVKLTGRELDALLFDGYGQAIDGIKVADDHWIDLWCDVDVNEYAEHLVEEGYGDPNRIARLAHDRTGDDNDDSAE